MKRIDPRLFNELRRTSASIAVGWLLQRRDGYTLGFTSSDVEFILDGILYKPTNAFSGTAATSKNNLSVDNMSAVALVSDDITEKDLKAGLYDNAMVRVFWVCPTHPEWGTMPLRGGTFGEVVVKNGQFEVELRAAMQLLQQPFGDSYTLDCSATFGDDRCKVQLETKVWQPNTRYISKADSDAGIGSLVIPTENKGLWFRCVKAGVNETPAVSNNQWAGPTYNYMSLYPDYTIDAASGGPSFLPQQAAAANAAASIWSEAQASGIKPEPSSPAVSAQQNAMFALYGMQKVDSVTIEGYTNEQQSFYQVASETSGVLVDSKMFLKPTKQYDAPLSSAPGAQPLTITNGTVTVTYAVGVSGPTEPVWPNGPDQEITDGTITWRAVYAHTIYDGLVAAVFSRGKFEDHGQRRYEPTGHYKYGKIKWTGGLNAGLTNEIREHIHSDTGATITLLEVSPFEIQVGDTYEMTVGCGKTRGACRRWDNMNNFRGFPDMPTEDKALATPNFSQQGTQGKPDKGGS